MVNHMKWNIKKEIFNHKNFSKKINQHIGSYLLSKKYYIK